MKKIQCTFRLPENIVQLIDEQDGETRTDKLLSLLGNKVVEKNVMQSVVESALQERVSSIEARLELLEKKKSTSKNAANQKRKTETINNIKNELAKLSSEQISNIASARYPLSEVRKLTNISKSQCDSYAKMIKETLGIKAA